MPLRAMSIKSALRIYLSASYGMKNILLTGSLCSPPPIRAAPDFPLCRGQNKTPRNTLFINGSTVSTGYSAPVEVLHRTSKWGAERHLNPQARQGLSIRRRPLWEYRKAHFPPTGIYRHSPHLLFLLRVFCIECASRPKLALSLHIKGPSYCRLTDPG